MSTLMGDVQREEGSISEDLNILQLPEEIALHIFSYLTAAQLSSSVAPVCMLWAEYCEVPQLWRHKIYAVDGTRTTAEHADVLKTAVAFHRLTIHEEADLPKLIPLLLDKCESIHEMFVVGECVDAHIFQNIVKKFQKSIQSLSLEGMELDNNWYSAVSCVARNLTSLSLNADCCVWAMGLLAVECSALLSLRLMSCRQTEDYRRQMQGVKRMLQLLPDPLQLLQLGAHITPNLDIMQAIGYKRKLLSLTVEDSSGIWDGDLFYLLSLQSLECLQLWRAHKLTAGGLLQFFECARFNFLKHLDFYDCPNLDDQVLQQISIRCRGLDTLDVSSCHLLTDYGISCIFQFCSHLQTLKMSYLPQPTGGDYLIQLPHLLPDLIYLDVYNCLNIPRKLVASLETNKLTVMFGIRPRRC